MKIKVINEDMNHYGPNYIFNMSILRAAIWEEAYSFSINVYREIEKSNVENIILCINRNNIESVFIEFLAANEKIENYLIALSAEVISTTLLQEITIEGLSLFRNLEKARMSIIEEALSNDVSLMKINLSDNSMSPTEAQSIIRALNQHPSLTELNLSYNNFGHSIDTIKLLGEALKNHSSLTTLKLESMYLKDEGALTLTSYLKYNTALTCLNVRKQKFSEEVIKSFIDLTLSNPALIYIDYGYNANEYSYFHPNNEKLGKKWLNEYNESIKDSYEQLLSILSIRQNQNEATSTLHPIRFSLDNSKSNEPFLMGVIEESVENTPM